jgi:hypothetical protein
LIDGVKQEKEGLPEEDKFDMLMDTLGWVVNEYLHEKKDEKIETKEKDSKVVEVEKEEGTIDLR